MEYLDVEGKEMPLVGLGCFSLHGKVLIESLTTALEEGFTFIAALIWLPR